MLLDDELGDLDQVVAFLGCRLDRLAAERRRHREFAVFLEALPVSGGVISLENDATLRERGREPAHADRERRFSVAVQKEEDSFRRALARRPRFTVEFPSILCRHEIVHALVGLHLAKARVQRSAIHYHGRHRRGRGHLEERVRWGKLWQVHKLAA